MVQPMTVVEEAIVDSSKKIAGSEATIKNLKSQYKELFDKYEHNQSTSLAKEIVDILISIKEIKADIKLLRKDIAVNIEELSKPKE